MRLRSRVLASVTIGLGSGLLSLYARQILYPGPGDFLWALRGARDLLAGRDPYGYPFNPLSVPYPLPAAFIGLPFAALPDTIAAALFFGLSSGILAFGLSKSGPWRLLAFCSYPYLFALWFAQWTPLVMAMAFLPGLLFLVFIKPHIALPVALSTRISVRGLAIAGLVLIASLAVMPAWPLRWYAQLRPYEGVVPLLVLPGPLLLLAVLAWRQRRARILMLMALTPQRMFYDQFVLWLIPENRREMLFLDAASWVGFVVGNALHIPWQHWIVVAFYLPALALLLWRHRQTAGAVLERRESPRAPARPVPDTCRDAGLTVQTGHCGQSE